MSESFARPNDSRPVPDTLRARLRRDLSVIHSELDAVAGRMDLETRRGYVSFLRLHEAGLSATRDICCPADVAAMRDDLCERVQRDLAELGADPVVVIQAPPGLHPLALTYVLAGSRLGSNLLRQRWEQGSLAKSGLPTAFMKAPAYIEVWRAFCEEASLLPANDAFADRILADAIKVFQVFQAGALAALERE